jgi:segregation and condensation protein A
VSAFHRPRRFDASARIILLMPLQEDYLVSLDAFHGPLDLLLYLIRRAEVDIHHIPIARITDQYIAFLRGLDDVDIEAAGDFLVMAATLVEIKSRTIAPPESAPRSSSEPGADAGSDSAAPSQSASGRDVSGAALLDPRSDLIRQLLEFQRYRVASEELECRRLEFMQRVPRRVASTASAAAVPGPAADADTDLLEHADASAADAFHIELEDAHILDLAECYERIMASIDLTRMGDHRVEIDDTPIALHQADLMDRLEHAPDGRLALHDAFAGRPSGQRVGLFLAALELTRLRRITVRQDEIDSEIIIERRPDEGLDSEPDSAPGPDAEPGPNS